MFPYRSGPARTLLLILLLALTAPATGQIPPDNGEEPAGATGERWWQVELVLFRYRDSAALQEEAWPRERPEPPPATLPSLNLLLDTGPESLAASAGADVWLTSTESSASPGPSNATTDNPGLAPPSAVEWFLPTPAEELRLGSQVDQLRRSGQATVLLHQSWRHRLTADAAARAYRVVAGRELTGRGPDVGVDGHLPQPAPTPAMAATANPPHLALNDNGAAAAPPSVPAGDPALEPLPHYQLEGTLTFDLRRFLHVTTDLWLAVEALPGAQATRATTGDPTPAVRYAHHREQRRLRSGEVHYLDNPLLGVVVLVTPWQKPADAPTLPTDAPGERRDPAAMPGA